MSNENSAVVKAADILAYAADVTHAIEVEVVNDDDLYPCVQSVYVEVDEETHKCTLSGTYMYQEDSPQHGVYSGSCEFSILGVNFSVSHEDHDSWRTSGKTIDYGEMEPDDFWERLQELVDIPLYDPSSGSYEFDESDVTDDDIRDNLDYDYSVFALDQDGEVCAFESEEDIPKPNKKTGVSFEVIDEETAINQLVSDRPGLTFSASY